MSTISKCKNDNLKYGIVSEEYATAFYELIPIDLVGPYEYHIFDESKSGLFHLLVVKNVWSRYTQVYYIKNQRSLTTEETLKRNCLKGLRALTRIHPEKGSQSTSDTFRKFWNKFNIKHSMTSSRYSQGNGISERQTQQ